MRSPKTWICALGFLLSCSAAFAQEKGQMRVRFQIFEIVAPFKEQDFSLDRIVWTGSRDAWQKIEKSVALLDKGYFHFDEGTLKLGGDGIFWDGVSLFFGDQPNIELPRGRIGWLPAHDVYLENKESSTFRIESSRKVEYFVQREDDLFERRIEEVSEGMMISVFPKLLKDEADLENLKIALRFAWNREQAQGTTLPVGRPVVELRKFALPLRVDLRRPYGILLRPEGWRRAFLICLDVTDVPQAVLDTIQREFPKCDLNDIKWNKKEKHYQIDLDYLINTNLHSVEERHARLRVELNGNLKEKEIEIPFSEVPPKLQALIKQKLDVNRIKDIKLCTTPLGEKVYKVDADRKEDHKRELDIAENGTILKNTM